METCRNYRRPVASENRGVPGPSVCEAEPLEKDPSGPRLCCAMEVEVVLMYSIVLFSFLFFSSFLSFLCFFSSSVFLLAFFSFSFFFFLLLLLFLGYYKR